MPGSGPRSRDIIIDNTQAVAPIESVDDELGGTVYRYESLPLEARPEIMALNPGPMTFRGNESSPSVVLATTFDHTERAAHALRERGIKPQVFLYHPGSPGSAGVSDRPRRTGRALLRSNWSSGSRVASGRVPDNVLSMVRNLPPGCIFQTCALGLDAIQVNALAILLGGHVRTGMEDCIDYQRDEPALDNAQLVRRVARIAQDLGRRVATIPEARQMLGLGAPSPIPFVNLREVALMSDPLLIRNARIVDVSNGAIEAGRSVLVRRDRIEAIGRFPGWSGASLDAAGSYLCPGLIDCHVHFFLDAGPDPRGSYISSDDSGRMATARKNARLAIQAGITTMRDCAAPGHLMVRFQRQVDAGDVPGPHIISCGYALMRPKGHCYFLGGEVATVRDLRERIEWNL